MKTLRRIRQSLRNGWRGLRTLSGDDAYDRYLGHCRNHHPDSSPMDRRDFYRCEQERRWSGGPNRCC